MPTLERIGRRAVLNHHREIPFHLLKPNPELSVGDPDAGNLIVQGDNLLALKALLPRLCRSIDRRPCVCSRVQRRASLEQ